ncbi:MAG: hypothetical protein QXS07_01875 [Candidatus Pacearchaeota archaeon]
MKKIKKYAGLVGLVLATSLFPMSLQSRKGYVTATTELNCLGVEVVARGQSQDESDYVGLSVRNERGGWDDFPAYEVRGKFEQRWYFNYTGMGAYDLFKYQGKEFTVALWDSKVPDPSHPFGYRMYGEIDRAYGVIPNLGM